MLLNRQKIVGEKKRTKYKCSLIFKAFEIVYNKVIDHYEESGTDLKKLTAFKNELYKLGYERKLTDLDGNIRLLTRNTKN